MTTKDILGVARGLDGNDDSHAVVDMGTYEFNPYRFDPMPTVSAEKLRLSLRGEPGRSLRIDRSRNLADWQALATIVVPSNGFVFFDATVAERFLFCRTVKVP